MRRYTFISIMVVGALSGGLPGCAPSVTLEPQGGVRVDQPLGGSVTIQRQVPPIDQHSSVDNGNNNSVAQRPGTAGSIDTSSEDSRRIKANLQREIETLRQNRDELHADIASNSARNNLIRKEQVDTVRARDGAIAKANAARHSIDTLSQQIQQLNVKKTALQQDVSTIESNRDETREQLNALIAQIAKSQTQMDTIEKQRSECLAAVSASQSELNRITDDSKHAIAELGDVQAQIAQRQGQLAEFEQRINAASETGAETQATLIVAPPPVTAAIPAPPAGKLTDGTNGGRLWNLSAIGGGTAMIIGAIALVAMHTFRKPALFTFTMLEEESKATHRIQAMAGDRVELGGQQPVKRSSNSKTSSPFVSVDHKGRLALRCTPGFAVKLNDRPIKPNDTAIVRAGNVVEVNTNGQMKRFVVGPVVAVKQGDKLPVRPLTASARSA